MEYKGYIIEQQGNEWIIKKYKEGKIIEYFKSEKNAKEWIDKPELRTNSKPMTSPEARRNAGRQAYGSEKKNSLHEGMEGIMRGQRIRIIAVEGNEITIEYLKEENHSPFKEKIVNKEELDANTKWLKNARPDIDTEVKELEQEIHWAQKQLAMGGHTPEQEARIKKDIDALQARIDGLKSRKNAGDAYDKGEEFFITDSQGAKKMPIGQDVDVTYQGIKYTVLVKEKDEYPIGTPGVWVKVLKVVEKKNEFPRPLLMPEDRAAAGKKAYGSKLNMDESEKELIETIKWCLAHEMSVEATIDEVAQSVAGTREEAAKYVEKYVRSHPGEVKNAFDSKLEMNISKYNTEAMAKSSLTHMPKPGRIFMGDDGLFWVVSMADGERLLKGGYEEVR